MFRRTSSSSRWRDRGVRGGPPARDAGDVVAGPERPLAHHQQLRRPQWIHRHRGNFAGDILW